MNTTTKPDAFTRVTEIIIQYLEKGIVPWKLSWADKGLPINLWSGKPYRSINLWLLNALDYRDNYFLTAHQVKKLGGSVKSGEQAHPAVYWHWNEPKTGELLPETPEKPTATLKTYYLFNIAQCTGLPDDLIPNRVNKKLNSIDLCKQVVAGMPDPPVIRNQGENAFYQPLYDMVTVPSPEKFSNDEYYYNSLFKRLILSTGHACRLNRKPYQGTEPKAATTFSLEGLTADMGTSYLCSYCDIDTWNFENRLEYSQGWIERFQADSRCMVHGALQALRAVDYILGEQHWRSREREVETEITPEEIYHEQE